MAEVLCPGTLAAGVAATLLLRDGVPFCAEALAGGRWRLSGDFPPATIALLAATARPASKTVTDPAPDATQEPAALVPKAARAQDAPEPLDINAPSLAAAKIAATRIAAQLKITFFDGARWAAETGADGECLIRLGYKDGRTGKAVLRPKDGRWTIEWRANAA